MLDTLPVVSLATPTGDGMDGFFAEVVTAHAIQLLERFAERQSATRSDPGLLRAVVDAAGGLDPETAWHPSFGALHAEVLGSGAVAPEKLTALGLRLAERGRPAIWGAEVAEDVGLRFDRWPLPPCRWLEVHASSKDVRVTTGGAGAPRQDRFVHRGTSWTCGSGLPELPEARAAGTRAVVLRRRELWSPEVADIAHCVDDAAYELMASRTTAALTLLERCAPRFALWVAQVVTCVAPWRVNSDRRPTGSSSSSFAPGLVGVGNHDHAPSLAESLVHEASHHYYYVAMRLGALHDGTDGGLYDNPFFGRRRPIDRILLAYHAFANVLALCGAAAASGEEGLDYFVPRERDVVEGLAVMEDALSGTPALTPLGRALFDRLREQVHDGTE